LGQDVGQGFPEAVVERFEGLGEDAGVGNDGHEIGIAGPTGNDVNVEVVGDACARDGTDVDAEIETLGFDDFAQEGLGEESQPPKFEHLGGLQFFEGGDFAVGAGHEMAAGIGVFVENEEGRFRSSDDEVRFFLLGRGGSSGKEEVRLVAVFGLVVLDTPRAPESFDFGFRKAHWSEGLRWKNLGGS
jgi:hypothetical protein